MKNHYTKGFQIMRLIADGQEINDSCDFITRIGLGMEPGWSFIEKFGENPNVGTLTDPEDVWDYGGIYTWSTAADIDTISSSDASDTQDIVIIGQTLDNTEVTQTATLNGQNKVTLSTPLYRVYRMYVDDSTDLAGYCYCYVDGDITDGVPDTASDVRAVINNGNNQTEMCIYTIPAGKQGFFLGGYVSMNKSSGNYAIFTWRLRNRGKVFRVQSRIACIGTGNSNWRYKYPTPVGPIPAGTDILIRAEEVEANNTGCAGGFTILLQDI